jgi:hypothetical protein
MKERDTTYGNLKALKETDGAVEESDLDAAYSTDDNLVVSLDKGVDKDLKCYKKLC